MKRCPECRRDYYDETLLYCLDDGNALLDGPSSGKIEPPASSTGQIDDEPQTAILHETAAPAEAATRAQIHKTDQTAVFPTGVGANVPKARGFDKRLVAAPLLAILIAIGVYFGYRYFNPTTGGQINSIAVLPFQNRSGDPNSEYLSDGLAESLIYRLSQLPDLKVSPTSSVIQYKGKDTKVATIASELGVDAVMTGRLAQIGNNLTISVELVDVRNNKLLWGEQYERKMADLLATQREIAATITQKLQLKLSGEGERRLAKTYTTDDEAYQLYLRGRFHFARRTKDDVLKSIEYYRQAAAVAPDFSLAYVGMAEAFTVGSSNDTFSRDEGIKSAVTAARKALELDPNLAEAHAALGWALMNSGFGNWSEAEAAFKRSIEINPNIANSHYYYSRLLKVLGRADEGLREMERAVELEPLSLILNANLAGAYVSARQYEKATMQIQRTKDLDPAFLPTQWYFCWVAAVTGKYDEILTDTHKQNPRLTAFIGFAYAKTGRVDEARSILRELQETRPHSDAAFVYIGLGDTENAFAEMEKAVQAREFDAAEIKVDPFWDPLRGDPRYKDLLKRMGLPE